MKKNNIDLTFFNICSKIWVKIFYDLNNKIDGFSDGSLRNFNFTFNISIKNYLINDEFNRYRR